MTRNASLLWEDARSILYQLRSRLLLTYPKATLPRSIPRLFLARLHGSATHGTCPFRGGGVRVHHTSKSIRSNSELNCLEENSLLLLYYILVNRNDRNVCTTSNRTIRRIAKKIGVEAMCGGGRCVENDTTFVTGIAATGAINHPFNEAISPPR